MAFRYLESFTLQAGDLNLQGPWRRFEGTITLNGPSLVRGGVAGDSLYFARAAVSGLDTSSDFTETWVLTVNNAGISAGSQYFAIGDAQNQIGSVSLYADPAAQIIEAYDLASGDTGAISASLSVGTHTLTLQAAATYTALIFDGVKLYTGPALAWSQMTPNNTGDDLSNNLGASGTSGILTNSFAITQRETPLYGDRFAYANGPLVTSGNWIASGFAATSPRVSSHAVNATKNADEACAAMNYTSVSSWNTNASWSVDVIITGPPGTLAAAADADNLTVYIGDPDATPVGMQIGWGHLERNSVDKPTLNISDGTSTLDVTGVNVSHSYPHTYTLSYIAGVTSLAVDGVVAGTSSAFVYGNPTVTLYYGYNGTSSGQTRMTALNVYGLQNAIAGFAIARGSANLILTWTAYAGADHYKLSDNGGAFGANVTSPKTQTGAALANHAYIIQAYDASGNVLAVARASYSAGRPALAPPGNYLPWLNTI